MLRHVCRARAVSLDLRWLRVDIVPVRTGRRRRGRTPGCRLQTFGDDSGKGPSSVGSRRENTVSTGPLWPLGVDPFLRETSVRPGFVSL